MLRRVCSAGFGLAGHSCGMRAPDVPWCWGNNEVGQLGLGASVALMMLPALALLIVALTLYMRRTG